MRISRSLAVATAIAALALPAPVSSLAAQAPEKFENLQVLPKDIARDSLLQIMRGFAFALGVRCEHCHVQHEGQQPPFKFAAASSTFAWKSAGGSHFTVPAPGVPDAASRRGSPRAPAIRAITSGVRSCCRVRSSGGSCIAFGVRLSIGREKSSGERPAAFVAWRRA